MPETTSNPVATAAKAVTKKKGSFLKKAAVGVAVMSLGMALAGNRQKIKEAFKSGVKQVKSKTKSMTKHKKSSKKR